MSPKKIPGLTGNQLKILAMIAMTCDHVGLQILPQYPLLRILGRLALPIYAFLVEEGCRHTRDKGRYLLRMFSLGAACQVVYFLAMGSLYQCILITFSLSICLIWVFDEAKKRKNLPSAALAALTLTGTVFLCEILPGILPKTDFSIDYGIYGVLLPVFAYFGKPAWAAMLLPLLMLTKTCGSGQWWAFAAVPLLMCYNGQRGKASLGKLFYWYYPAHLAAVYGLSLIL